MRQRALPLSLLFLSAALFLTLSIAPYTARAQFAIPQVANTVSIIATPPSPGPHELVHLRAEANTTAVATWTVNGKAVAADDASSGIDVQTGEAGEKMVVTAQVQDTSGPHTATLTIIPTSIDLLIDATSYIPPFFKGRPLASSGTSVRALAIPHFGSAAAPVAPSNIVFTWRQGGSIVASGQGKATATLEAPPLFGSDTITVDAYSIDGIYQGSASVRLPGIDPDATLYMSNPLVGVEYYNAIEDGAVVGDVEATLIAVPYFTSGRGPNDPQFIYEWKVNGKAVPPGGANASEITINASGSSGLANLSLVLSSSVNFFLHAEQSWNINFPGTGSVQGSAAVPSSSDVFHAGIQ